MRTVILTIHNDTDPGEFPIVDEVRSNAESVGAFVKSVTLHPGDVVGRFTAWAADDEAGYDTLIEIASETGLIDQDGVERAIAGRLKPGEPGYFEPVNAMQLRQDITDWMIAGVGASVDILASSGPAETMRAFTKHHEKLLAVLAKHKLIAGHEVESPTAEAAVITTDVHQGEPAPAHEDVAGAAGSPGKCGQCLMERIDIVALLPDGTCPKCGGNYSQGIAPRF